MFQNTFSYKFVDYKIVRYPIIGRGDGGGGKKGSVDVTVGGIFCGRWEGW